MRGTMLTQIRFLCFKVLPETAGCIIGQGALPLECDKVAELHPERLPCKRNTVTVAFLPATPRWLGPVNRSDL